MDTDIGALFAIIIVKQLYGGLGQNFMNPPWQHAVSCLFHLLDE